MSRSFRHIMIAIAAAAYLMGMLAGCVSDENLIPEDVKETIEPAISFNGSTGTITRASGSEAASLLGNSFVVYGYKTSSTYGQTVYDHYNVNYTNGSANTTTTNTAGWEYVGQTANVLNSTLATTDLQDIKYWDMAANSYDFVAFSLGNGGPTQQAVSGSVGSAGYPGTPETGKVIITPVQRDNITTAAYTITGATDDLAKIYVSDRVTATKEGVDPNSAYKQAVQFAFRSVASKVRIGLYETIPGYSVKEVKFYATPAAQTPGETTAPVTLYAGSQTIPSGKGTIEVSFPETNSSNSAYNKAKVTYASSGEKSQTLTLGALTVNAYKELNEEEDKVFLGRTSSAASKTGYTTVIPAPAGALTLKMDFTLVSIDYNETITVKGAEAVVPAKYADWKSNYAYTYIFKISDAVGGSDGKLLYPVIFDALEVTNDFGLQQTITTVDQPSITTYAKGALGSDYFVGDHIYISVMNGTAKTLDASNSTLYTATASPGVYITETNIIENTSGISLTPVASDFMTFVKEIAAIDSPSGDVTPAKSGNFAKFTAGNAVYVFKYTESVAVYYQTLAEYNADHPDDLKNDSWWSSATDEEKIKTPAGDHYKVIKVGDARRPMSLPDIPEEDM